MLLLHFWSLLALVPWITHPAFASVLAIDYGTDWIKASLMKQGVPFDVLLNKDSKRKIQSSVGWKDSDRLFGSDAFNLASRFPLDSFSSIKYLQAAPFDSDSVSFFTTISTADVIETSRKTVALRRADGTEWNVEELVAMQFAYVKELAETLAGETVHDVIVTVPSFYSQFERDAVADAIEIAGLRTLALINDGTAVAVNYAMTRSFPIPEYHIIYDAGASSIRATLVSFASPTSDPTAVHITVAGIGYDRTTGGTELDRRLREILIENFNAKHNRDIRTDKRGMAKLWKEAGRIKAILSANTEATATIESIAWDIDFKSKVARSTFEIACAELKDNFSRPIYDALNNAGLTLDKITSVILTGGSTRTPMIQAAVRAAVGDDKIALNVNADEAAVLGAAFHGAGLSRKFKTKHIKVTDITAHDVQASYLAAPKSSFTKPRTISTVIFPAGSKVGIKKTLTFKRKEDFALSMDYKHVVSPGFPVQMLEAEITGVCEALGNLTERGAVDPVVKATVSLSESGFVSVQDAIAFGEIKDDSIAGKLKGLFGAGSASAAPEETESSGDTAEDEDDDEAPAQTTASAAPAEKTSSLKELSTISLNITTTFTSIAPMTVAEKRASRSRLRNVDYKEAAKQRREEARNSLESYLYRVRDLLDEENRESPFRKCSQDGERRAIGEKLSELIAWLQDRGDAADTAQFLDKRNALESLERPIVHRYKEIEAFPAALNNSQLWNWSTRLFLNDARANLTAEADAGLPSKWTRGELDSLERALKEHETWLNEWVEKQKGVRMDEDPVIETTEMRARAKALEGQLQKLVRRRIPKVKKAKVPPVVTPTAESGESATAGVEDESSRPPPIEDDSSVPQGHDEL